MDLHDILPLFERLASGTATEEELKIIETFLEANPNSVSEDGYDILAEKAIYEMSLLERRAEFETMMHNASQATPYTFWLAGSLGIFLLICAAIYLFMQSYKSIDIILQETVIVNDTAQIIDANANVTKLSVAETETNMTDTLTVRIMKKTGQTENSKKSISTVEERAETKLNSTETPPRTKSENTENMANVVNTVNTTQNAKTVHVPTSNKKTEDTNSKSETCPDYTKDMELTRVHAEYGQNNGAITILSQHQYLSYSIDGQEFVETKAFRELPAGTYTLYIKDNNSCQSQINTIVLSETYCLTAYNNELSHINREWSIPINSSKLKGVQILNIKRQTVYAQSQISGSEFVWDGTDASGSELPGGLYKVIVTYSNETCVFNVSILD